MRWRKDNKVIYDSDTEESKNTSDFNEQMNKTICDVPDTEHAYCRNLIPVRVRLEKISQILRGRDEIHMLEIELIKSEINSILKYTGNNLYRLAWVREENDGDECKQ